MSPSRRISMARAVSIGPRSVPAKGSGSVDVVTVPPRADVALRIEGLAAQRTRQPSRSHDRQGAVDEATCLLRRESDPERVGTVVLVLVVVVDDPLERGKELRGW